MPKERKENQLSFDFYGGGVENPPSEKIAENAPDSLSDAQVAPLESAVSAAGEIEVSVDESVPVSSERRVSSSCSELKPLGMRRAVLGWLASLSPTGMSLGVPTRVSKFKADAAAFWSKPNSRRVMRPDRTLIVEIRHGRGDFWPDCAESGSLLPILRDLKDRKASLEARIRVEEPELKDTDILFDEYATWNYASSKNRGYHKCLRRLEETEKALYSGSRFERIRSAHVANHLYLAAPAGTISPNELADGWGLLAIHSDLSIEVVKEPEHWDCPEKNQLHLIQNIASKCFDSVCFANGVSLGGDGTPIFLPIPRKRRAKRPRTP
jgi:hypothetical protein